MLESECELHKDTFGNVLREGSLQLDVVEELSCRTQVKHEVQIRSLQGDVKKLDLTDVKAQCN